MPYRLRDDIMEELSSKQISEEEKFKLCFDISNERTEEEKKNEIEIAKLQRKYLYNGQDNDFILKEKRYYALLSPRDPSNNADLEALGIIDPIVPEERKKLFNKILNDYTTAKKSSQTQIGKENRIKYYKIYFLGSLGQADVESVNVDFVFSQNPHINGKQFTIVTSPKTGIGMIEAENYLINANWDLKLAFDNICRDKGLKNEYDSINYIGNVNTQFNSFFRRFDDDTRKGINKVAISVFVIIMLGLLGIVLNAQYHFF